jgi:hypothetical protein
VAPALGLGAGGVSQDENSFLKAFQKPFKNRLKKLVLSDFGSRCLQEHFRGLECASTWLGCALSGSGFELLRPGFALLEPGFEV